MSSSRRAGRVAAMQILYQMDTRGDFDDLPEAVRHHFDHLAAEDTRESRQFAEQLCTGVVEHLSEIDHQIERASKHWRLARMSRVDRNVLRLATYELIYATGMPVGVAINEAVDIGKEYGATESGSFINGVLNKIAQGQAPDDNPLKSQRR